MSDPFAPLVLPARPLLQLGDIAAQGASARIKDLETRMQEKVGRSRVEMERGYAMAQSQYRADVRGAEEAYRTGKASPLGNLITSLPQMALDVYDRIRADNQEQTEFLENARLTTQRFDFNRRMRDDSRELVSMMELGNLSPDDVQGYIDKWLTDNLGALQWSDSKEMWSQRMTFKHQTLLRGDIDEQHNFLLNLAEDQKIKRTKNDAEVAGKRLINEYAIAYGNGDDSARIALEKLVGQSSEDSPNIFSPGTLMEGGAGYVAINKALVDRLSRVGEQAFVIASRATNDDPDNREIFGTNKFSTQQAVNIAHEAMRESLEWKELQDREGGTALRDTAVRQFETNKVLPERAAQIEVNKVAQTAFDTELIKTSDPDIEKRKESQFYGLSGNAIYNRALAAGFDPDYSRSLSFRWNEDLSRQQQLTNAAIKRQNDENIQEQQSLNEVLVLQAISDNPEVLGQNMFASIRQMGANGFIPLTLEKAKFWMAVIESKQKGISDKYQPEREWIDAYESTLGQNAIYIDGVPHLEEMGTGFYVPLSVVISTMHMQLAEWIANGSQVADAEGNVKTVLFTPMVTSLGEGESGGMLNAIMTFANVTTRKYHLRGSVGRFLGLDPIPKETGQVLGAGQPFTEPASFDRLPLAGTEVGTARSLLEVRAPEQLDAFDRRTGAQQIAFSLSSLPLNPYTPGQTMEEATDTLEANVQVVERYRQGGHLWDYRVDPTNGSVIVQLVQHGSWHLVAIGSQTITMQAASLIRKTIETTDMITLQDEGTIMIDGAYLDIPDPAGARPPVRVTSPYANAVTRKIEHLTVAMVDFLPHLGDLLDRRAFQRADQMWYAPGENQ